MARQIAAALFIGALCIATSSAGVLSGLHAAPAVYSAPLIGSTVLQGPQNPTHIVNPLSVALPAEPLVVPSPAQTLVAQQPALIAAAPAYAHAAIAAPAYAAPAYAPTLLASQPLISAAPAGLALGGYSGYLRK